MAAGARIGRSVARRRPAGATSPTYGRRAATATAAAKEAEDDEQCGGFLPWLRSKAGADISSVLRLGTSPVGRSLFASQPIREGDCIMEVPHSVQLTGDKLPEEVCRLLDDGAARDTTKISVLLMMEQHLDLGQGSGWAPYVRSLPCKDQMHNMMRKLYGDCKLMEEEALKSANLAALVYLQNASVIFVDGISLIELRK